MLTWSEWRLIYPDGSVSTLSSRAETREAAEADLIGERYADERKADGWRLLWVRCQCQAGPIVTGEEVAG